MMMTMLLFLSAATVGQAQWASEYYHRTGDTVEQTVPIYYYQWWNWDQYLIDSSYVMLEYSFFQTTIGILTYFYTPTPIKVIGVAAMADRIPRNRAFGPSMWWIDKPDTLMLCKAGANGPELLAAVPFHPRNPEIFPPDSGRIPDSCRYLRISSNGGQGARMSYSDTCCGNMPWYLVNPVYEYYFDTAFVLTDSFYVGGTQLYGTVFWAAHGTGNHYNCAGDGPSSISCEFPYQKALYKNCTYVYMPDGNGVMRNIMVEAPGWSLIQLGDLDVMHEWYEIQMVFPIIEVDTTVPPPGFCPPVGNVQVTAGTTDALVTWDWYPGYTNIQLQYGMATRPTEQWTTIDTSGALYSITGLDPTIHASYGVRVRASCNNGKKYTQWSDIVYFYPEPDTTSTGIDVQESELSRSVTLLPNPANGEVTVSSASLLQHIEIRSTKGTLLYSEHASSHMATIDLEWLHAGTYIVTVQTMDGTTSKKLVVK